MVRAFVVLACLVSAAVPFSIGVSYRSNVQRRGAVCLLSGCAVPRSDTRTRALAIRSSSFSGHADPFGVVAYLLKRHVVFPAVIATVLLSFSKAVSAASSFVKGFDLYGRIPYDDWLFSTARLVDADLLKRSFVETIVQELPDVLGNFKKRKQLSELWVIVSGMGYFFAGAVLISVLYKGALAAGLRRGASAGKDDLLGRGFSASAISKKGPRKGKQIENMDEGWLDMEVVEDAVSDKKKDDDEEEEDEKKDPATK